MLRRQVSHNAVEVSKVKFKSVDVSDTFFDVFRASYGEYYNIWVLKKSDDDVYVVRNEEEIVGFLKLKVEDENEDYSDIIPHLSPKLRLKISSMRTVSGYPGLGGWLMRIVFLEAYKNSVKEIYGTVPVSLPERRRVERFMKRWGFRRRGLKMSRGLSEVVFVRQFKNSDINKYLFELG